jgi:erythromycin esterase-like protein/dienelactone hydrolase
VSARSRRSLEKLLRTDARVLQGSSSDFDPILEQVGDARFVLIGEASHGTHEFYRVRADITKRLISERGFTVVAVEADWPDALRIERYVHGHGKDAAEALAAFERFPQWKWRNSDVLEFVTWLRSWNEGRAQSKQVGFYGLDFYSLHRSTQYVLDHLRLVDPELARLARERYASLELFGEDPQTYGHSASLGLSPSREREVVDQLILMQREATGRAMQDGGHELGLPFSSEQDPHLTVTAEQYYRGMFAGRSVSWNMRDRHMAEMLEAVDAHHSRPQAARIVVWAHNSHLGDPRATHMSSSGELNLGQLLRERHGLAVFALGFTTFSGTVIAASEWGGRAEQMEVREALAGSWERLFHDIGSLDLLVDLRNLQRDVPKPIRLLERAIGAIYRPDNERSSHYFAADLPRQFDAVLHYDRTRAVEPLEQNGEGRRASRNGTHSTQKHAPTEPVRKNGVQRRTIEIVSGGVCLIGSLTLPRAPSGVVVFTKVNGSPRKSSRSRTIAATFHGGGLATLLLDLMTPEEEQREQAGARLRYDVAQLVPRLVAGMDWLADEADTRVLPLGLFGVGKGTAVALAAAALRPARVSAIVSRSGRPDLAERWLGSVKSPTLLIVGGADEKALDLNRRASGRLVCVREVAEVPGATHLFEEPGALDQMAQLAREWFSRHLPQQPGQL